MLHEPYNDFFPPTIIESIDDATDKACFTASALVYPTFDKAHLCSFHFGYKKDRKSLVEMF